MVESTAKKRSIKNNTDVYINKRLQLIQKTAFYRQKA